jgi:hypothetical protein
MASREVFDLMNQIKADIYGMSSMRPRPVAQIGGGVSS